VPSFVNGRPSALRRAALDRLLAEMRQEGPAANEAGRMVYAQPSKEPRPPSPTYGSKRTLPCRRNNIPRELMAELLSVRFALTRAVSETLMNLADPTHSNRPRPHSRHVCDAS